jgi:hypothetical protein
MSQAEQESSLLSYVTSVQVSGIKRFVAADAFGPKNPAGINFWLDADFKRLFLSKVKENVEPATIAVHRLKRPLRNSNIIAELGPENEVIRLAHFYKLIKAQANGETGPLLVKERVNIACIESEIGDVRVVVASWNPFYRWWRIGTFSVSWVEWSAGHQVLFRKPA